MQDKNIYNCKCITLMKYQIVKTHYFFQKNELEICWIKKINYFCQQILERKEQ